MKRLSNLKYNKSVRDFYNLTKEIYIKFKYYDTTYHKGDFCVIFNIDGRLKHGGLADRISGILCCYAMCKIKEIPFYINFYSPFLLSDFLDTNLYNWKIDKDKISYNIIHTKVRIELGNYYWYKNFKISKQTHFYSNFKILHLINKHYSCSYSYSQLYNELFTPTQRILEITNNLKNKIDNEYLSVCIRFQSLLGDFKEKNFPILNNEEKNILIIKCINKILELRERYENLEILVTSDSYTFLNEISKYKHIHIISGKVVHMDYVADATDKTYEKSFVDFYMLGGGIKIINICGDKLRQSGFPELASLCFGKELEICNI